jgi:hypothetical protein
MPMFAGMRKVGHADPASARGLHASYFRHDDTARARASSPATACQNRTGDLSYNVRGRRTGSGSRLKLGGEFGHVRETLLRIDRDGASEGGLRPRRQIGPRGRQVTGRRSGGVLVASGLP